MHSGQEGILGEMGVLVGQGLLGVDVFSNIEHAVIETAEHHMHRGTFGDWVSTRATAVHI